MSTLNGGKLIAHARPSSRRWIISREGSSVLLFYVSVIGLYTQFHLYGGSTILFPFVLTNIVGISVLLSYISKNDARPAAVTFGLLTIFAIAYLGAAMFGGYFGQALNKFFQLIFSIFCGYGIAIIMTRIPPERLRKILTRLAMAILIVAFAEVYLGFYPIMLDINAILYAWRPQGFYINAERDMALWGGVRPLAFSTEPSLVGIWGSILMIGATILSTSDDWRRYVKLVAYVGALLFISRSTTSALVLVFYLAATLFDSRNSLSKQLLVFGVSIGMIAIMLFTSASTLMGAYMEGTSFFARILGPYLTTVEVFRSNPIFGVGLGNEGVLTDIIMDVWNRTGMLAASAQYVETWGVTGMLTNNFFWIWINFGLIGGVVFFATVLRLVRQLGSYPILMPLLASLGAWMTVGGFVDLRSWFFVYFFIGCAILFESSKNNAER